MKGGLLNVRILTGIALGLGLIMAILNLYPSWSQYAGNIEDPLLYATLFCIASAFMIASFAHPESQKELTKLPIIGSFKMEHCFRAVSYFFGGVIAFSVNSDFWLVETFHLLFTGLAILTGYLGLMTYPSTKEGHTWAFAGLVFGLGGFIVGYLLGLFSISWGEVLASIPLALMMYLTWKK